MGLYGKRICTLKKGQSNYPELDYLATLKILEKKIDTVLSKNAIVVLEFIYYNDICAESEESRDNFWSLSEIREFKKYDDHNLRKVKRRLRRNNQNLYVFHVFEKNIKVENENSDYIKEFIKDSDNFFRENYFREQSMCSSYLVITPTGTLLHNGELNIGTFLERVIN